MEERSDNVILFPKWKKQLEEDSVDALKGKRYSEALEKLDQLIHYGEANQEVYVGKLICLMELGKFQDAQILVEELLRQEDDGYYDYMHIYLTLLFQTDQHDLLVETVDEVLERDDLPQMMKEQYQQLYAISENMRSDLSDRQWKEDLAALEEAVKAEDHRKQWNLVEKMRNTRIDPGQYIIDMLTDEKIHPMTKTAILLWLKKKAYRNQVSLHKFGRVMKIIPNELPFLEQFEPRVKIGKLISDIEQENPTRYKMMMEALERYIYVIYPAEKPDTSIECIAEALAAVTGKEESETTDSDCQEYIDELNTCQALYLSIMES